jgi:hypothetical protein
MAARRLILRRDETMPLPYKIYEEIASAVNSALFQLQALAQDWMIIVGMNVKSKITTIRHQDATEELTLLYQDIIIKEAGSVDNGIIDVEGIESWARQKIHTVPQVSYMGKGFEGLQKMIEGMQEQNKEVALTAQVRWLLNPSILSEIEPRGDMKALSVIFIVRGKKVALRLVNKGQITAGV